MKQNRLILLSVIGLVLFGVALWLYLGGKPPSATALGTQALSGKTPKEREQAAVELTMLKDPAQAAPELRRVAKDSKDPKVKAIALRGLGAQNDSSSLMLFLDALNDPELEVRQAAYEFVSRYYAGTLPGDQVYDPNASAADRAQVVQQLKADYEKSMKSGGPP